MVFYQAPFDNLDVDHRFLDAHDLSVFRKTTREECSMKSNSLKFFLKFSRQQQMTATTNDGNNGWFESLLMVD